MLCLMVWFEDQTFKPNNIIKRRHFRVIPPITTLRARIFNRGLQVERNNHSIIGSSSKVVSEMARPKNAISWVDREPKDCNTSAYIKIKSEEYVSFFHFDGVMYFQNKEQHQGSSTQSQIYSELNLTSQHGMVSYLSYIIE